MIDDSSNEQPSDPNLADRLRREESVPYAEEDTALFERIRNHLKAHEVQTAAIELKEALKTALESNPGFTKEIAALYLSGDIHALQRFGVTFQNGDFVYNFTRLTESSVEDHLFIRRKKIGAEDAQAVIADIRNKPGLPINYWEDELTISDYSGPEGEWSISGPAVHFKNPEQSKFMPGSDSMTIESDPSRGFKISTHLDTEAEFVAWGAQSMLTDLAQSKQP